MYQSRITYYSWGSHNSDESSNMKDILKFEFFQIYGDEFAKLRLDDQHDSETFDRERRERPAVDTPR